MLKKTITYTDYNGVDRTETFYFNMEESEILEMEMSTSGGFAEMIQGVIDAKDQTAIIKIFKDLVFKAYGRKSPDGRYFEKSEQLSREFSYTPAYSKIFMELATDETAAAEFVNGIMPAELAKQAALAGKNPIAAVMPASNN